MNIFARLKGIQKFISSMEYPGMPFQVFVATDGDGKVLVNGREYCEGYLALMDINSMFIMQVVGSDLFSPANGVACGVISPTKRILGAEDAEFRIEDADAAKAWLLAHKIIEEPDGPSVVYYEEETGFLFVKERLDEAGVSYVEQRVLGINEIKELA